MTSSQGTLTEEICENGLVFDGYGDIHNHCNYNWAVDCGKRVYDDTPISSPGCLYQFGIYPVGEGCQTTFFKVRMTQCKDVLMEQSAQRIVRAITQTLYLKDIFLHG